MSDTCWWEETADTVYSTVEAIAGQRTYLREDMLRSLRLYGDTPILGWGPTTYTRRMSFEGDPEKVREKLDLIGMGRAIQP